MRIDIGSSNSRSVRRGLLQAVIVAAGLLAIVGSGGGGLGFFPDLSCLNTNSCPGGGGAPVPPPIYAVIDPGEPTVQVGTPVVFSVDRSNVDQPTYTWCRLPKGESDCTLINGVTGATYTLAAATLSDDGAVFRVTVRGLNGSAIGETRLAVSSMPGVVFEDGEFLDSDWATTAIASPPLQGSTASASRSETGGNPGAFRSLTHQLPPDAVPRSVRLFNTALLATYDPVTQGAIYVIEFSEDCVNVAGTASLSSFTLPMIEQAGRRYSASDDFRSGCASPGWYSRRFPSSFRADYFVLADGPACGAGESCPDFSASGAPIRFGFVSGGQLSDATLSGDISRRTDGIDNWKVTVWRR